MKKCLTIFFLISISVSHAQVRDTLKLTITKIEKQSMTTGYSNSIVDTIAMQPVTKDTSKIVTDKNTQDLKVSKYKINVKGSVRVNGYYDFNGMTSTEGFLPYDIAVEKDNSVDLSSVYIGAR